MVLEAVLAKCESLGLHPADHPMGDGHHTDVKLSDEDKEMGHTLAWFMGTLFGDIEEWPDKNGNVQHSRYWYYERTSADEWSRVARALRIHGLKIVDISK